MKRRRKLFKAEALKREILEEQGYHCAYCAAELDALNPAVFDHFVPWIAGGRNNEGNIFACCERCNRDKAAKVFASFEDCRLYLYELRKFSQDQRNTIRRHRVADTESNAVYGHPRAFT